MSDAQTSRQQWQSWILFLVRAVGRLGYESSISFASMYICHDTTHNSNPKVKPELDERGQSPELAWHLEWLPHSIFHLQILEWSKLFLDTAQGRKVLWPSGSGRNKFSPHQYTLREASLSRSENWVSQCWIADAEVLWVLLAFCFTESQNGVIGKEHLITQGSANYDTQAKSSLWLMWFLPF